MSVNYFVYVGPYFNCTKESYKEWVSTDLDDEFNTIELNDSKRVAFVPNTFKDWGVYLSINDNKDIKINSVPNDGIAKLVDKYKGIIPFLPEGITAQYGLVSWWG